MKNDQGILFDVAMIGPAFSEGLVCCIFLSLIQRQKKTGSPEPERLLVKNAYSTYRLKGDVERLEKRTFGTNAENM